MELSQYRLDLFFSAYLLVSALLGYLWGYWLLITISLVAGMVSAYSGEIFGAMKNYAKNYKANAGKKKDIPNQ